MREPSLEMMEREREREREREHQFKEFENNSSTGNTKYPITSYEE